MPSGPDPKQQAADGLRLLSPSRRRVLLGGATLLAAGAVGANVWNVQRQPPTTVLRQRVTGGYGDDLARQLGEGLAAFPAFLAKVKGSSVVLKPNLVEVHPDRPINTDPRFIVAVAESLLRAGAKQVTVAEGAGHTRDSEYILEQTGLDALLRDIGVPFVDLNLDDAAFVRPPGNLTGLDTLPVAKTVMAADLFVSLPKLKTHHHVGVTLSMKNLFGTVPGSVVGWPKNPLHFAGISNSIVDLWSAIRPAFAIVDGIVGMEGDGPIMGSAVDAGVVLMGEDLPSVDAAATRAMGLRPERVGYMVKALSLGATIADSRIDVLGDEVAPRSFAVIDKFARIVAH
ncbi:MAG: DUF362 domain-containing protein [Alphaproteobacteria bacterium]|nr:DUF362 domain-containing protein [Alphaproteobacteria bacterium]